jgi:hypothetical protein
MEDWVPCVWPEGRFLLERPGWWEVDKEQGTADRLDQLSGALNDFQIIDRAPAVLSSKPAAGADRLVAGRRRALTVGGYPVLMRPVVAPPM